MAESAAAAKIILRETTSRDDIDDAIAACGWRLCNIAPADVGRPAQIICVSGRGTDLIYFIHDAQLDALYVAIAGPEQASLEARARAALPAYSPEEIAKMACSLEENAFMRGLGYAALIAPPGGGEALVGVLRNGLSHKKANVRSASLVAAAYAAWPDVKALVRGVLKNERDDVVRAQATKLIASWDAQGAS
jgi:hypothetical protein